MPQHIVKLADVCAHALRKLDPQRLEMRFPTPELKERFETAKALLLNLLSQIDEANSVPPELLARMEECSRQFRELCMSLGEETELYGKSAVNQMIHWAEVGYVERTIFLPV